MRISQGHGGCAASQSSMLQVTKGRNIHSSVRSSPLYRLYHLLLSSDCLHHPTNADTVVMSIEYLENARCHQRPIPLTHLLGSTHHAAPSATRLLVKLRILVFENVPRSIDQLRG